MGAYEISSTGTHRTLEVFAGRPKVGNARKYKL